MLGHHGNKANLMLGTVPVSHKTDVPSDTGSFFCTGNCISIPHKVNRRKLVGNDNC